MIYNYNVHDISIISDISLGSNMECFYLHFDTCPSDFLLTVKHKDISKVGYTNISNYMLYNEHSILLVDKRGKVCESLFLENTSNSVIINCEVGFDLTDLMDLVIRPFIRKQLNKLGRAFVHASAFSLNDKSYLMTAWANTGKTGTVLSALYQGATYLGDDLCIINEDAEIFSYPVPLNLFDYNLRDYPELVRSLTLSTRFKLRSASYLSKFFDTLSQMKFIGKMAFFFYAGKLFFDNAAHVRLSAAELGFKEHKSSTKLDKIILVERSDYEEKFQRKINCDEIIVYKMQTCIDYEFKRFLDYEMSAKWSGWYKSEYFPSNYELDIYRAALCSTNDNYLDLLPKIRDFGEYLKEVVK